jgi:hypothetical protein
LGGHPFTENGHANFGGDVTRFHVQPPQAVNSSQLISKSVE